VPFPQGKTAYLKHGRKHANTPAVVSVAAQVELAGGAVSQARLALNAVGPYPFRARGAEELLINAQLDAETIAAAARTAAEECEPFTDAIANAWYRQKMANVFVRRALTQIAG
jgi:CO/xanthine dehydrogenase FAD-binding subunit